MTNLSKRSIGDWDILAKRNDMIIGEQGEGDILTLGLYYPVIIVIEPTLGKGEAQVYVRLLKQTMKMEWALAVPREMEMIMTWALGIIHKMEAIEITIPLAKIVNQVLELSMPLHTKPEKIRILVPLKGEPKFEVWFKGTPKSKRKTVATIKALSKLLKSD